MAEIEKIVIADDNQLTNSWFKEEILNSLGELKIEWIPITNNDGEAGIVSIQINSEKTSAIIN